MKLHNNKLLFGSITIFKSGLIANENRRDAHLK